MEYDMVSTKKAIWKYLWPSFSNFELVEKHVFKSTRNLSFFVAYLLIL